ncbi:MAG: hypothetical protein IPK33_09780 [Gemmatimonadetes bacterium]|nr:hypothetical protein [Gemmatimonadota bacterium]
MIPHTPLLLVTAAQALARQAHRLVRERPDVPCSLEFMHTLGFTAHLDLRVGLSSWPVERLGSFDALREMARCRRWERERLAAGDLVLMRNDPERASASGSDAPREEVGVVLQVLRGEPETTGTIRLCAVVVARPDDEGGMQVMECHRWCDTRERDLGIRWYATFDDIERAA